MPHPKAEILPNNPTPPGSNGLYEIDPREGKDARTELDVPELRKRMAAKVIEKLKPGNRVRVKIIGNDALDLELVAYSPGFAGAKFKRINDGKMGNVMFRDIEEIEVLTS